MEHLLDVWPNVSTSSSSSEAWKRFIAFNLCSRPPNVSSHPASSWPSFKYVTVKTVRTKSKRTLVPPICGSKNRTSFGCRSGQVVRWVNPHHVYCLLSKSQSDMNGINSLVIVMHSFLLFIFGLRAEIQKASNAFLAEISFSRVRILHFISKSFPSCASILCLPSAEIRLLRHLLDKCSLMRIPSILPVSPMHNRCSLGIQSEILLPSLHNYLLYHKGR